MRDEPTLQRFFPAPGRVQIAHPKPHYGMRNVSLLAGKQRRGSLPHAGVKRMHDSRSNVSRTGVRAIFVVSAISVFSAAGAQAESGVLRLSVKDVNTHYALQADVIFEGPQKVSVRMNDTGRASLALIPGEYRIEASEPSHKTLRTHCNIGQGANLPFTIFLEPERLPAEELPEGLNANVRAGFTLLHGYVVEGESGQPIVGVNVRMDHANVETRTDSLGHYLLSVPTPVSNYPGGMGTDTLIFEKKGYSTEEFTNFGVTGEEMGGIAYGMEKGSQIHKHDATHKLMKKQRGGPQSAN
jgi:hypothetical protein